MRANPIVSLVFYFVAVGGLDDRYCRCMENAVCCFALKTRITRNLQANYKNKEIRLRESRARTRPNYSLFIFHYSFYSSYRRDSCCSFGVYRKRQNSFLCRYKCTAQFIIHKSRNLRPYHCRSSIVGGSMSSAVRAHSFAICRQYSSLPKFESPLLLPNVNFTPRFFAALMNFASGIL